MQPCLCKNHFRQVSNYFDKETALAYAVDDKNCVICSKVIFLEAARRYVHDANVNVTDPNLRLPDAFARLDA